MFVGEINTNLKPNIMTKQDLLNEQRFSFSNEEFQESNGEDDIRIATCFFIDHGLRNSWATGFKIEFNGQLVHSSKTFDSMQNKLNKLIGKWHLKLTEIEE